MKTQYLEEFLKTHAVLLEISHGPARDGDGSDYLALVRNQRDHYLFGQEHGDTIQETLENLSRNLFKETMRLMKEVKK